MGGGGSKSETRTDQSTDVTTTTTTNIGDIGLTGNNVVQGLEIFEVGLTALADSQREILNFNRENAALQFATINKISMDAASIEPVIIDPGELDPRLLLAIAGVAIAATIFAKRG